jgi:hypothetical protein
MAATPPPDVWHALEKLLTWAEAAGVGKGWRPPSPRQADSLFHATARSRPGESVELVLELINDQRAGPVQVEWVCTDLVSAQGRRIAAERIAFEPAALWLPAQSSGTVALRVDVPPNAEPGLYAGLLRATNLDDLKAIVTLGVEELP